MRTPKFEKPDNRAKERWPMKHVLKNSRGALTRIAEELNITVASVSLWLDGRINSERIEAAVKAKMEELNGTRN